MEGLTQMFAAGFGRELKFKYFMERLVSPHTYVFDNFEIWD